MKKPSEMFVKEHENFIKKKRSEFKIYAPRCSECDQEFTKDDKILYCEDHKEYFHGSWSNIESHICESEHSQGKHGAYYREGELRDGKIVLI